MPASIRATTVVEGSTVTLNVAAMTAPPPPPPPPLRVSVSRRGAVVTIKKGNVDITIDIPADATRSVTINARGRVVCNAPSKTAAKKTGKPRKGAKKSAKRVAMGGGATAAMTDPPPPPKDKRD